ncbi:unannotated protein [freshwater metagenome]|uniref:Unannotated protein n=1 Tax=freshwater metagenome TaxID=449393 RepID=A0A6J6J8Z3_9ZZZZ
MRAARSRATGVASYGGTQPSRIFDPAVDGMSSVHSTSLTATGMPASELSDTPPARAASTSSAIVSALSET